MNTSFEKCNGIYRPRERPVKTFGFHFGSFRYEAMSINRMGAGGYENLSSPPVYSPLSEASPLANIDMQDATSYTVSGATITAIKNIVSGVSWTLPVNNTPYEATGLNGHPCLHPIVVGDRIETTEAAVWGQFDCPNTGAAKPYTIYYVQKIDTTTTGAAAWGVGNSGVGSASTRVWGQRATVATYQYAQTAPAANATINSATAVDTNVDIVCWHSPGVGVHLHLNNGAQDSNSNTTTDPTYTPGTGPNRGSLFSRPDNGPDSPAVGRYSEFWIFGAEHDAAAQTRVYNFLATKWA